MRLTAKRGARHNFFFFFFKFDPNDDNSSFPRLLVVQQTGVITARPLNKWQLILSAKWQVLTKSRSTAEAALLSHQFKDVNNFKSRSLEEKNKMRSCSDPRLKRRRDQFGASRRCEALLDTQVLNHVVKSAGVGRAWQPRTSQHAPDFHDH